MADWLSILCLQTGWLVAPFVYLFQSLEFVAETMILAEMEIENRGRKIVSLGKKKSRSILFCSTKIKVMDL